MVKLEALEYHSNEAIRTAANHILDMYYGNKVLYTCMYFHILWIIIFFLLYISLTRIDKKKHSQVKPLALK